MGRGGGFEISDIPGRGEGGGVVCESSDVRKFLKKSKFQNFSQLFKVKTRNFFSLLKTFKLLSKY